MPRFCWQRVLLPFKTSAKLRDSLCRFDAQRIRIGKLLEIFDFLSEATSRRLISGSDHTLVTTCVDNFQFYNSFHSS